MAEKTVKMVSVMNMLWFDGHGSEESLKNKESWFTVALRDSRKPVSFVVWNEDTDELVEAKNLKLSEFKKVKVPSNCRVSIVSVDRNCELHSWMTGISF